MDALERKLMMEKDVQDLKRKEKEVTEQKKLKMVHTYKHTYIHT